MASLLMKNFILTEISADQYNLITYTDTPILIFIHMVYRNVLWEKMSPFRNTFLYINLQPTLGLTKHIFAIVTTISQQNLIYIFFYNAVQFNFYCNFTCRIFSLNLVQKLEHLKLCNLSRLEIKLLCS